MKPFNIWAKSLAVLLLLVPISGTEAEGRTQAAEQAAVAWLAMVDGRQYEASWAEAATFFRNQVSTSAWIKAVTAARRPLGSVVGRELLSANYATTLPGAPDGEYVVLQYKTSFTNKAQAIETVTPMLDQGQWRVCGYYVR